MCNLALWGARPSTNGLSHRRVGHTTARRFAVAGRGITTAEAVLVLLAAQGVARPHHFREPAAGTQRQLASGRVRQPEFRNEPSSRASIGRRVVSQVIAP
jgi:hypothetical protein